MSEDMILNQTISAKVERTVASPDGTLYPLPVPALLEMIRKDKELYNFFKLVDAKDFRMKALELLESRLSRH